MRIGILIREPKNLQNWELNLFSQIIKNPHLNLVLLIKDGRSSKRSSIKNRLLRLFKSKNNFFGKILYNVQLKIESLFFKNDIPFDRENIEKKLSVIDTIYVTPTKKSFVDFFEETDVKIIESYKLDIILRHEFNIIRGKILKSAKFGIWSFHHGDNSFYRGGPVAFWEIINKESVIGVTLQKLTSELDGGLIIDKAFYNLHWSAYKTESNVLEYSSTLLIKNINRLIKDKVDFKKSDVYYNQLFKAPNLYFLTKYLINFYINLIKKVHALTLFKIFSVRSNCWTIFIGKGNFLNANLFRLKNIKPPKNEFWADPFLFQHKLKTYVFFENYNYLTKKGKISCGIINDDKIDNIIDVLDLDYHLSFPFVFTYNDEIFMIPESSENNRLEIYKSSDFPTKWELYSTGFEGYKISDTIFYSDKFNQKWLFLTKHDKFNAPKDAELYIYKIDSLKLNNIQSHNDNPVKIDSRFARCAGPFFQFEGDTYRPSQANIYGNYGKYLNINKIKKLTIDDYIEENIKIVKPNFKKGLISTHHLHQYEDIFVIDAAYDKY